MKQGSFLSIIALLTAASCTSSINTSEQGMSGYNVEQRLPGDSAVYGLACDGSTDSILVYLPFSGGDPDTIDILNARESHRVFGRPDLGDEVAVILNDSNKSVAEMVINLERLKGQWCYEVQPRLRLRVGSPSDGTPRLPKDFPDSLLKKWLQPREYGIELLSEHIARTIGVPPSNERNRIPVEYPEVKRYRMWNIYNGHILLSETRRDTLGEQQIISTDTADIVLLRRDSLRLRFKDHEQGYYRKDKEK
jgi:hypothetical protein